MPDLFDIPFEEPGGTADPVSPAPPARQRRVFTVSALTFAIRGLLEDNLGEVWIEGELSNCRVWNTGHLYFTLKDDEAQIRAVMFRMSLRALRFTPEDGLHVIARGRLGVYAPKGEYQIVCEHMEPHGLGARQLAFDQLKKTLQAEGLFDAARKRPLPRLPRKIGIVTSLDGAALRDIIKVLRRRHPNAHLVIRPARVQGEGAAGEITRGIRAISTVPGVDVVIAARGGGSVEDLWAFNEEMVVRAIAASPVPVISAVGHEVDVTIADFVADLRAPTPSAAAEMVVAAKDELCQRIDRLHHRLGVSARSTIDRHRGTLHALTSRRGLAGWQTRLAMRARHAAELTHQVQRAMTAATARRRRDFTTLRQRLERHDLRRRFAGIRGRLEAADGRLAAAARRAHDRADARLRVLAGRLDSLSPLAVLARGYAVCWDETRTRIIRRADSVSPGDRVTVTLQDGELECRVEGELARDASRRT
jgi:exodeoxyribonuclease VII large subunit